MKKFVLFLFLLAIVFAGSFTVAQNLNKKYVEPVQLTQPFAFKPIPFPLKNLPFTFVIVGVNNGASVAKTLDSVFSQNYENYRLIYIDDASDDGSFELVRDLIFDSGHLGRVTLVQNEKRLGKLANICRALQTCEDPEIVVVLEGEDWLAHEWVLQKLNSYYADSDLWMTYGQYRDFPTYQLGICHEAKENRARYEPFGASHLKTFYAALFKKIRESDFISGGEFLQGSADLAYMIPMLELANGHCQFISETLYIHNRQTNICEDRELQMRSEKFIRSLDPYPPLTALQVNLCGESS